MKKTWTLLFTSTTLILLSMIAILVICIDPYFHFHAPLDFLEYRLYDERYQNDGILRHFDYDSIIIGTSMTRNFRPSEWDTLMNARTIKVPFSAASYREIGDTLIRALDKHGTQIKYIIRGLDYSMISDDCDYMKYDSYPAYLYNDNYLDDIYYLFNKHVIFEDLYGGVLKYTMQGHKTISFDRYRNDDKGVYGKDAVMKTYKRKNKETEKSLRHLVPDNLEKNVIEIARNNPNTEFYLFFTPYSILYFDQLNQKGELLNHLIQEKEAIELLVKNKNIHLFSFFDEFDLITDFDNYIDYLHYGQDINSYILRCMASDAHRLTEDNYHEYCDRCMQFYLTYNYNAIFD